MNIYIVISIICSFCTAYTLYRYYKLFFDPSHLSAIAEKLCYFILFLINISAYLVINIPLVTLLSNIATRFLITYLYPGKLRHRIFLSLSFCIIATLFETAVFFLFIHTPIHIGLTNLFYGILIFICFNFRSYKKTKSPNQATACPLASSFGDSFGFILPHPAHHEL